MSIYSIREPSEEEAQGQLEACGDSDPYGIYDSNGNIVGFIQQYGDTPDADDVLVAVTREQYAMLCGAIAPAVNIDGITGPWSVLQSIFPSESFYAAVEADLIEYDDEAGQ